MSTKAKNKERDKKSKEIRKRHRRSSDIKLDSEMVDFFCEILEKGRPLDYVCAELGIPQPLVVEWLDKATRFDKDGLEKYAIYKQFEDETRAAVYRYLGTLIDKLGNYPAGEWQKFSWLLERRDKKNFSKESIGDNRGTAGGSESDKFL